MIDEEALRLELARRAAEHVVFDGWSEAALRAAASESGTDLGFARGLFPKGGVDLARAFHRWGDRELLSRWPERITGNLRYRDKVAEAVMMRLEIVAPYREAVRRAAALFALPQNLPYGAEAAWQSADAVWNALGDRSEDANWHTKRLTLAGVFSATVLYWLGDESPDRAGTRAFLDRRMEGVMRFEAVKGKLREGPLGPLLARLEQSPLLARPKVREDLPGRIGGAFGAGEAEGLKE